jgi:hypothetical protein
MTFQLGQTFFQTMSQWHVWRLGLDFVEVPAELPQEVNQTALMDLHRFFVDLLADLYAYPQEYGLPNDPYEAYTEPRERLSINKEKVEWMRAARLKARVAIETGIFDFLYQVGQVGEIDEQNLCVDRILFDRLIAEKMKKTRNKKFPRGLERTGLVFTIDDMVNVSNTKYPDMMAGMSSFAKECAKIQELGFYFFRRGDFGVFSQKNQPAFEDALHLAPAELGNELLKTDALLTERKFKREIFVADAGGGYRFRYSKKSDKIVYWVRLMSWFSPEFHHNLRWKFDSDLTPGLFHRLDESKLGLADRIFEGIKKCEHDYEGCIARVVIQRGGMTQECCSEVAWDTIGETSSDFEDLHLVLSLLDEMVSVKR